MNKDQIKGSVKEVAGKVQNGVGKATGSTGQRVKGLAKEVEGKVQKGYGDAREEAEEAQDRAHKR